jgi:hypothetical protein
MLSLNPNVIDQRSVVSRVLAADAVWEYRIDLGLLWELF